MAKKQEAAPIRPEMQGKALCFVGGTTRPTVAPLDARYVLRHPDGSAMVAESTSDTVEACRARFEVSRAPTKPLTKKEQEAAAKAAAEQAEAERKAAEEAELERIAVELAELEAAEGGDSDEQDAGDDVDDADATETPEGEDGEPDGPTDDDTTEPTQEQGDG